VNVEKNLFRLAKDWTEMMMASGPGETGRVHRLAEGALAEQVNTGNVELRTALHYAAVASTPTSRASSSA
jgi:hypothetical protein